MMSQLPPTCRVCRASCCLHLYMCQVHMCQAVVEVPLCLVCLAGGVLARLPMGLTYDAGGSQEVSAACNQSMAGGQAGPPVEVAQGAMRSECSVPGLGSPSPIDQVAPGLASMDNVLGRRFSQRLSATATKPGMPRNLAVGQRSGATNASLEIGGVFVLQSS
jgi:hypothetical protein